MPPIADVSAVGKIVSAPTYATDSLSAAAVPVNAVLRYLTSRIAKQNPERLATLQNFVGSASAAPIKLIPKPSGLAAQGGS